MDVTSQKRTASVVVAITGLWIAFSPLLIDMSTAAMWNAIIAGSLLALMGVGQMFTRSAIPSVLGVMLAVWLAASALFVDLSIAGTWSLIVAGVIGFVASFWDVMAAQDISDHQMPHSV